MTVVGVTGHTNLTSDSLALIEEELLGLLRGWQSDLVGMTCLARGADQAFAEAVLALGGALHVVVPSRDYFTGITDPTSRELCNTFLNAATSTVTMPYDTAGPAAYLAASRHLIDRCEVLLAVWDGSAPTGSGGTADAVAYAGEQGRTVVRAWPDGVRRG